MPCRLRGAGGKVAVVTTSPLQGILVVDATRVVAGPLAGQMLADLGADVVKIERPGTGDDLRHVGPPWVRTPDGESMSSYFLAVNRGKMSVELDFDAPEDAALARDLLGRCDVFIENFRTGTLARHGLGFAETSAFNPRIIYCSITGFGQTGPRADQSGYDYLIQAMTGLMDVTGRAPGRPGAGPMRVGVPIVDIAAAKDAVIGILAALRARDLTGQAQRVDISLFDSSIGLMLNPASAALNGAEEIRPSGNDHPSAFPYGVFPVADGEIIIATFSNAGFKAIAAVLGHPEWATDLRFAKPGDRVIHRADLEARMIACLKAHPKTYWIERLTAAKVSCGPINTIAQALTDPHVAARGLVVVTEHPRLGTVRGIRLPVILSGAPRAADRAPPLLGADTERVRETLGPSPSSGLKPS